MKDEATMFLIGFFGGLFFGVMLTLAWPGNAATVTHDLTTKDSWAGFEIQGKVALMYGGTIAHDGGSVTIPGATVPMTVTVDLYHRYMQPGTGGLRIGGLSVEWDADGWQVRDATGTRLHRETQPRAWSGKRVRSSLAVSETGIEVVEPGANPVRIPAPVGTVGSVQLWSSVKAVENAPRWLAVGIETADPTPTPTPTPSPSPTETPSPTPEPTPTATPKWIPEGWIRVWRVEENLAGEMVMQAWWTNHIRRETPPEEMRID